MNQKNILYDAVASDWDDEVTTEHTPDPRLLARASTQSRRQHPSESGVSEIPRPPPPPSRKRAQIQLLPLERLRVLLARFTECAGPAARPVLLSRIQALQATPERFPLLLGSQLITSLAACLDDPATQQSFISDARRILEER